MGSKGSFPAVYPILLYTAYGVATVLVLSFRENDGRAKFESWFAVDRIRDKFSREAARVVIWIVVMNAINLAVATIPFIAGRELLGVANVHIP